jgi:Na+-transporting NADH:ubiquinone oxidoreductase subunit C
MRTDGPAYTIGFAAVVCIVCSLFVASANVLLKDAQRQAKTEYIQKTVLLEVTQLVPLEGAGHADRDELFRTRIRARLVDLASGEYVDDPAIDPMRYDQRAARNDPKRSRKAPENDAEVARVPNVAVVYQRLDDGVPVQVVLPIEGQGLYSEMFGFISLDRDGTTIRGLAYYEQGETPGLGGEVANPKWRALWPGRKAFDNDWEPAIELKKGGAGPPETDPHRVDAISGATVTSYAVADMLSFWLGESGFGPYLARTREKGF